MGACWLGVQYAIFAFFDESARMKLSASLVQLVERRSPKPDVVGSSPTGRVQACFFCGLPL